MDNNPVQVSDLQARRALTPGQLVVAPALLTDAWAIIQARVPSAVARIEADPPTLAVALVISVETAMVLRVLANPDGKRQESIDDYSWTRDNAVSAGLLYMTGEELTLLGQVGAAEAFTIRPYGQPGYAAALDSFGWNL